MSRTYMHRTCGLCGASLSSNGLAQTSHQRKHAREGLMVERRVRHRRPTRRGWEISIDTQFDLTEAGRAQYSKRAQGG